MPSPLVLQRIADAQKLLSLGQNYIVVNGHEYQLTGVINPDGTLGYIDLGPVAGADPSASAASAAPTSGATTPDPNSLFLTNHGVTGLNPIAIIHPNAASASTASALGSAASGASSSGVGLSSIMGLGGTAAQIWQTSKLGKGNNIVQEYSKGAGGANGTATYSGQTITPGMTADQVQAIATEGQAKLASLQASAALAPSKLASAQSLFDSLNAPGTDAFNTQVNNAVNSIVNKYNLDTSQLNSLTDLIDKKVDLIDAGTKIDYKSLVDGGQLTPQQASLMQSMPDDPALLGAYQKSQADALQSMWDSPPDQATITTQAQAKFTEQYYQAKADLANTKLAQAGFPAQLQAAQISPALYATNFQQQSSQFSSNFDFDSLDAKTQSALERQFNSAWSKDGGETAANLKDFTEIKLNESMSSLSAQDQQTIVNNALKDYGPNFTSDQLQKETADFLGTRFKGSMADALKQYQKDMRSAAIQGGLELGAAATAGYFEEDAINDMFSKGFSGGKLMQAVGSALGMWLALHMVNGLLTQSNSPLLQFIWDHVPNLFGKDLGGFLGNALTKLTSTWGIVAIQGLIVLLGFLLRSKPSAEQTAAETLNQEVDPLVWNANGSVIFLTAGLTMATMGLNLSPSAPMMQTMTLSQAAATAALTAAGASDVPSDSTRYADVFVEQGGMGQPTRVVYLVPAGTDSKGNAIETMTVQTLKPGQQFATSQPTTFIPFFVPGAGGKPVANPQVVQSLADQQHLLQCADGTWVTDAARCAAAAGATSHVTNSGGH